MPKDNHDIDDLLAGVIAEKPAEPKSEFAAAPMMPTIVGQDASLAAMVNNDLMMQFIEQTKRAPLDAINDAIIGHGYALVLWKFREAAIVGDIDRTRSLKMWLEWAQPHINRPKPEGERIVNPAAAAFLPREVK